MTQSEQCKAVKQQLLRALNAYEAAFSAWAATPARLCFSQVDAELDKVRVLRVLLPQLSEEMAAVVTAHANLGTMLVRDRTGTFGRPHSSDDLARARSMHSAAVQVLRSQCLGCTCEDAAEAVDGRQGAPAAGRHSRA